MAFYAAIDIGTNSTRLLIAEEAAGKIIPKQMLLRTTRLGEDLAKTGIIKKEAIERTSKALREFRTYLEKWEIVKVAIVATSAAREANNKEEFIKEIKKSSGFDVEIISGKKEAALSYRGAVNSLPVENPVVIDIGGGSTEIMYSAGQDVFAKSTNVGAVVCTESSSTPTEIKEKLSEALDTVSSLKNPIFIGVGGTITTLSAVKQKLQVYDPQKVHGSILKKDEIDKIFFDLCEMTLDERKKVPGLQPQRADIIIAGTLILWVIMTYLDIDRIYVSEADILQGIILELMQ